MALFKTTSSLKRQLEDFFDTIDEGALVFKLAVNYYLEDEKEKFSDSLVKILRLESKADDIRRDVENKLYTKSLLPQFRGDVIELMEKTDDIIDIIKSNLSQFDVEIPDIPKELHSDLRMLTELTVSSVEHLIPAARRYFRDPLMVRDELNKVYFYEKETDKLANEVKRKIFREIPRLKLSEKIHLRYFTLHIEEVSDVAEEAANLLSIMSIKRTI